MMMKVFPHGTGRGGKPSRYLVRDDYPNRDMHPPQVLRGDPAMTTALIDSIDRRWKFTSGVLAWHPDDKVNAEKEEEVMDAFENVAFAGLEPDQRNILWVRHTHAGHHELHFLIPRVELSSGKDFNACPPGWQKDFDVFRDLFNWRENWARPDDPTRARTELPKKADLFYSRMTRWGKKIIESDRDKAKEVIHAHIKAKIEQGLVHSREDIFKILQDYGLKINRKGKNYLSVVAPESGLKMRFKGGIYGKHWNYTAKSKQLDEESEEEQQKKRRNIITRLEAQLERVIDKRTAINNKRYPIKWAQFSPENKLLLPEKQKDTDHDRNRKTTHTDLEKDGGKLRSQIDGTHHQTGRTGGEAHAHTDGIAHFETLVHGCKRSVQLLADLVGEIEKRRLEHVPQQMTRRMR